MNDFKGAGSKPTMSLSIISNFVGSKCYVNVGFTEPPMDKRQ